MIAQERYRIIEAMFEDKKTIQVSELMERFNVSVETVRRDLAHLEKTGILKRVHGGAVKEIIDSRQTGISQRESENWIQKLEIGEIVSSYLSEGETIAFDSGTTSHALIKVIKNNFRKMTVLTNYLPVINELVDTEFTVVSSGGALESGTEAFVGELALNNLGRFHVDKSFITISGISLTKGLTDFGFNEIEIKKKLMNIASEVYVIADSTKFSVISLLDVCDFKNVKAIFTDSLLDNTIKAEFEKIGVRIINSKKTS